MMFDAYYLIYAKNGISVMAEDFRPVCVCSDLREYSINRGAQNVAFVVGWWCLGRDQRRPSGPVQCCVSCSHCTYDGLLVFG